MRKLLLLSISVWLVGCGLVGGENGFMHNRGLDYRKAQEAPRLNVPAGTAVRGEAGEYNIPTIGSEVKKEYIDDPIPPGFDL